MNDKLHGMDRRGFLKTTLGATAAGAAVLGAGTAHAAKPDSKTIALTGKIPERPFGKTGHMLPVLGHGGSAMVDSWATAYGVTLEPQEQRVAMVRRAYDLGVRYFDTARVYSESESIMGKALKDVRANIYLATKMAFPTPGAVRGSVEKSLSELQTDYVDCMQIHSPAIERVGFEGGMKLYDELVKLKDEGMIRFIGVTTHVAFETVHKMISTGAFDQVLLARGYIRKGMDMMLSNPNMEWANLCVAKAHELNMGIVAMKVMGLNIMGRGGHNVVTSFDETKRNQLPGAAIRWALNDSRVSVLNIGVSVPEDIELNAKLMQGDLTYTESDAILLAEYAEQVYKSDYVKALQVV